jgi:probable HAF family extracellular repeat protein
MQDVSLTGKVVICWTICFASAQATAPFFKGLGDLPGGSFGSSASGVSADGSVVVGGSSSAPGQQAFRWTQSGGMVGLGRLPGNTSAFYSKANGVSDDGSVVVGESLYFNTFSPACGCWTPRLGAFRWTQTDGMLLIGTFGTIGVADDASADGLVVVGHARGTAFRWSQDTAMEFLTDVAGAAGVSSDGSVIAGSFNQEAVRWTLGGEVVGLGDLPGESFFSQPYAVSSDGSVVVGWSDSAAVAGYEAFRWTEGGGMAGLGVLPGFTSSLAYGASTGGSIVVGKSSDMTGSAAFLWDATHGMRSLRDVLVSDYGLGASLAGWSLTSANDISADGQFIVGSGTNPSGNSEAWLARIAPVLPGDFNHNGSVDAADYVVWRKTDGSQAGFNVWRTHFGTSLGPDSGAARYLLGASAKSLPAAVPEPTSALLAATAGAALLCRRKAAQRRQP